MFLGLLNSAPLMIPGRHALNLGLMLGNVGAMGYFLMSQDPTLGLSMLGVTTALSSVMGVTLTMAIGGKLYSKCSVSLYVVFHYISLSC